MQTKPIILIMTSKDEPDGVSEMLKKAVQAVGSYNVVVIGDEKYGKVKKMTALYRLMEVGYEYQSLLEKKDKGQLSDKLRLKPLSKRAYKISNAVKRFNPEYILTLTPYAHHSAVESKKRTGFKTPIINMMFSFTLDNRTYDTNTAYFIVENAEIKAELVQSGVASKKIIVLGLPFTLKKRSFQETALLKQEFGLPRTKTIFVNIPDKKQLAEVVGLLADQGDIINIAVYTEETGKEMTEVREAASLSSGISVTFVSKKDMFDSFLSVSEVVITKYDVQTIYKCFKGGIPVITYGKGENTVKDIDFLVSKGLVFNVKDNIDVVGVIYKILQTSAAAAVMDAASKWVENSSLDNTANYLSSF